MKNHLFVSISLVLASRRLSSGDHDEDAPPVALELKSSTKSPDWNNYCPSQVIVQGCPLKPTTIYLDRNGASSCGNCIITTSPAGTSNGFDDSFAVSSSIFLIKYILFPANRAAVLLLLLDATI
jgi:hypothetical protein